METFLRMGRLAHLIHSRINPPAVLRAAVPWCYTCHSHHYGKCPWL